MIQTKCGACGTAYQLPDAAAGKKVKCKACGEVMSIPAGDADDPLGIGLGGGPSLEALSDLEQGDDLDGPTADASLGFDPNVSFGPKKSSAPLPLGLLIGIGGSVLALLVIGVVLAVVLSGGDDENGNTAANTNTSSNSGTNSAPVFGSVFDEDTSSNTGNTGTSGTTNSSGTGSTLPGETGGSPSGVTVNANTAKREAIKNTPARALDPTRIPPPPSERYGISPIAPDSIYLANDADVIAKTLIQESQRQLALLATVVDESTAKQASKQYLDSRLRVDLFRHRLSYLIESELTPVEKQALTNAFGNQLKELEAKREAGYKRVADMGRGQDSILSFLMAYEDPKKTPTPSRDRAVRARSLIDRRFREAVIFVDIIMPDEGKYELFGYNYLNALMSGSIGSSGGTSELSSKDKSSVWLAPEDILAVAQRVGFGDVLVVDPSENWLVIHADPSRMPSPLPLRERFRNPAEDPKFGPAMIEALGSWSRERRRDALSELRRIDGRDNPHQAEIARLLEQNVMHPNTWVSRGATDALEKWGDARTGPFLAQYMKQHTARWVELDERDDELSSEERAEYMRINSRMTDVIPLSGYFPTRNADIDWAAINKVNSILVREAIGRFGAYFEEFEEYADKLRDSDLSSSVFWATKFKIDAQKRKGEWPPALTRDVVDFKEMPPLTQVEPMALDPKVIPEPIRIVGLDATAGSPGQPTTTTTGVATAVPSAGFIAPIGKPYGFVLPAGFEVASQTRVAVRTKPKADGTWLSLEINKLSGADRRATTPVDTDSGTVLMRGSWVAIPDGVAVSGMRSGAFTIQRLLYPAPAEGQPREVTYVLKDGPYLITLRGRYPIGAEQTLSAFDAAARSLTKQVN